MNAEKNVDAVVEEVEAPVEDTQYAPVATEALTPEEAAKRVLDPPASAAKEPVKAAPISNTLPVGVVDRKIEGGYIVETLDQGEGLPIAESADADYQARLKDTSVDYTQTRKDVEEGETVEK